MSSVSVRARLPLRIFAVALGIGLFAYLVWRAEPGKLFADVVALRWGVVLIIVLAGCSHLAKTFSWVLMLRERKQKVPFSRLFGLRLGAEAMGQLGIVAQTLGDSMRIAYLSPEVPVARGVSSVSLDRGIFFVTGTAVTIFGIATAVVLLPLPTVLRQSAGIFVFVLCGFLLFTGLVVQKRWSVLSRATTWLARLPFLSNWVDKNYRLIRSVEDMLFAFYHETPRAFWASFVLNLACHVMAVGEVCLILYFLGTKIAFLPALGIEALTKLLNAVGNLNPGNIGTYEAGTLLIGKIFGLSSAAGLALGVSRRIRALFWAAVGGVYLFVITRSNRQRNRKIASDAANHSSDSTPQPESRDEATPAENSLLAVILSPALCSDKHVEVTSPRVGSLTVLLRAILTAQKTGAARIIVVIGSGNGLDPLQELQKTGRLPASVEWLEAAPGMPLSYLLTKLQTPAHSDRVLLIEGNRTYHPILVKQAAEWQSKERGVALVTGDNTVGIYVFPSQLVRRLSYFKVETLADLQAWVPTTKLVQAVPVGESLWQRVETSEDCQSAERKLDRWLVKTTDGFYARMNRRISIPISRQLIKWPITPNMVSLFTLAIGLASSLLFATGGYWYMLAGALLSLWASILDGCDGEVARLKLMESDFGCWLETACDYLYYLFLFIGLMLGLEKTSGSKAYLIGGAVLLFGALASFLTVALQRRVLASEHPEQLLQIWQERVDSRRSNLLLFVGRHTEFIVRRCFFPYALVIFALFNVMSAAFWFSVLGANLVWPIALYSCLAFRRGRRSAAVTAPSAVRPRPRLMTRGFLETP